MLELNCPGHDSLSDSSSPPDLHDLEYSPGLSQSVVAEHESD